MGWEQAEGEARLREQVNQVASQQGWTQAQAEAVFREQHGAAGLSQQGLNQALAGQQNQFTQGLQLSSGTASSSSSRRRTCTRAC